MITKAQSKDARMVEAERRLAAVTVYRERLMAGLKPADAALAAGRSRATMDRLDRAFEAEGFEGLIPKTANCGRKSARAKLEAKIGKERVAELLDKARATALDTGSATTAIRLVARAGDAPEEFVERVSFTEAGTRRCRRQSIPPSLMEAVRIDPVQRLAHRGPRAQRLNGMWTPRRVDVLPGDILTSDDTTPIWAWWVPWTHALGNDHFPKASAEYRFGVKLLQGQFLPLMDVASQAIIQFALIARETAAYRASDIWAMFGRAFSTYGLPRLGFQLERGSWEANLIRGVQVEVSDGEVSWERRVGGLRMLPSQITDWHREKCGEDFAFPKGLQIWTSFMPKSKSIEAAFDRLQRLEGTIWGCLGRDQMRAPNERAKKQYEACRRGSADPREHFLSGTELVRRLQEIIDFLNDEPMEGQVFRGVPRMLWQQAILERPLIRLPEEQHYLFRRSFHATRITSGWVRAKYQDDTGATQTALYTNPMVFGEPGMEGRQVVVYYDAEDVQEDAQIIDAATDEYLCTAEYHDRRGMFLDTSTDGHKARRLYNQAVTTLYGDMAKLAPSRQVPAEIIARREAARTTRPATETETVVKTPDRPRVKRETVSEESFKGQQNRFTRLLAKRNEKALVGAPGE